MVQTPLSVCTSMYSIYMVADSIGLDIDVGRAQSDLWTWYPITSLIWTLTEIMNVYMINKLCFWNTNITWPHRTKWHWVWPTDLSSEGTTCPLSSIIVIGERWTYRHLHSNRHHLIFFGKGGVIHDWYHICSTIYTSQLSFIVIYTHEQWKRNTQMYINFSRIYWIYFHRGFLVIKWILKRDTLLTWLVQMWIFIQMRIFQP